MKTNSSWLNAGEHYGLYERKMANSVFRDVYHMRVDGAMRTDGAINNCEFGLELYNSIPLIQFLLPNSSIKYFIKKIE